jgi:branched-chain amino acid transport system ATP-binding protein
VRLETKGLCAGYDELPVLRDIDLQVGREEIVALVGANGAGKSTLVKTLSGLVPPSSGSIALDGAPIGRLTPRERVLRGIVHVPEGRQVFAGLTIAENLRLGAWAQRSQLDARAMAQRVQRVGERFPILLERLDHPAGTLSGGQQQMLAIARGLMAEPRFLLLDEPSLGLAPLLVTEIFRLIQSLRAQGLSILLSEQNARLSLAIADRAYVIETGRVTLQGRGSDLLAMPEVAERYLGMGRSIGAQADADYGKLVSRLRETLAKR